jgi:hypothetical protein
VTNEAPRTRTIIVDCTVALEVTVQYDPVDDTPEIIDVTPDWSNFQVGIPYYATPHIRMPNTGISGSIIQHLQRNLPRGTEMRWNPTTSQ